MSQAGKLLCFIGAIWPARMAGQSGAANDAVVTISTRLSGGRVGYGHGFFVSPTGRVVTAYHVVEGAQQITVFHQGKQLEDVVIEQMSPDLDLVTLRVKVPATVSFLNPVRQLPADAYRQKLGLGIVDQTLASVTMLAPDYVRSARLPVRLEKIFAVDTVRLLSLDGLVYSGWSGAAVIAQQGVIGVLSGSLNEGGSLIWGIPIVYLSDATMRTVNQRASQIREWPPLRLMASSFTSMRRTARIDDRLLTSVQAYFEAAEAFETAQAKLPEVAAVARAGFSAIRQLLPKTPAGRSSHVDDELMGRFEVHMTTLKEAADSFLAAQNRLLQRISAVAGEVLDAHGELPRTQHNLEIAEGMDRALDDLEKRGTQAGATEQLMQEQAQGIMQATVTLLQAKSDTVGAFLKALEGLEQVLRRWTEPDVLQARVEEARLFHQFGTIIERLLRADFDGRNASWRWASGKGYTMMLPAGWELADAADSSALEPIAKQLAASGSSLDMGFFDVSENVPRPGLLLVGRWGQRLAPAAVDSLIRAQPASGGLRIERVHLRDAEAFFLEAAEGPGVESVRRCDAVIAGPQLTVFFRLSPPPGRPDLIGQCRTIVENVSFTAP